jgi:glycosyltransferase involved in cell wall biosynthesis
MTPASTPGRGTIAVIVPCYNDGATLREAVDSARSHERVDELVVVDDGSTDPATLAEFDALQAEGVRVVHRTNGGLGLARMSGVGATQAAYVFPLDADDRLLPGALTALGDALDDDPGLALAWGDYRLFGSRSFVQRTAERLDAWQVSYQNDLPASALVRREALLAAGGWELRGGYEDWDLWMALAERGERGRRVPIVVYEYRQHGPRMLTDSAGRHADIYDHLRARHPGLFAARGRAWRRSRAPLGVRLALPLIFALPLSPTRRRLLAGATNHLAQRRGLRLLLARARYERAAR